MELRNYLFLIYKHKYLMLISSLIAIAITFSLTKKMAESYSSKARLATGIVDQTEAQVLDNKEETQESKINLQFANLIQSIQLKKIFDQVSYQLILHDLKANKDTTAFRKRSKLFNELNNDATKHAIEVYTKKYEAREPLYLYNEDEKGMNSLIVSMGYDIESLKKKMTIYRLSNSDFVDVEFESENPNFCAFVINTLCKEFITYYNLLVRENHIKGVNFLEALLHQKRDSMNFKMQNLKQYKIDNRVLNLNEQAKSIYAQIADFDSRKELTEKDILAYSGAIKSIDAKFDPNDRMYIESLLIPANQSLMRTKDILKKYSEVYIKSNYDPKVKIKIDSLQTILSAQINQVTDKYILNPLSAKENLVNQKLTLQVQLDIAKNSIASLEKQKKMLSERYDKLVPHEAVIQSLETEVDISSKEYIEILQKFNQSSMESSIMPRLKLIELAMPGPPAPSKKTILIAVSGIVPIVLYIVVLFVVFYLDDSIKNGKELANKTNIPVLGYLPLLSKLTLNLESIWKESESATPLQVYKDLLRSARFEIAQEMGDGKILTITSVADGEGKSFIALSLAYAYKMANKQVLLIDADFEINTTSEITKSTQYFEEYLDNTLALNDIISNDGISVLANKSLGTSLFELNHESVIREKLHQLKDKFDITIIDATSLDNLNKSKEWIVVADKVLSVFEANQTITNTKQLQINYLTSLNEVYIGWILNKVANKKTRLSKFISKLKSKGKNIKKKRKKTDD